MVICTCGMIVFLYGSFSTDCLSVGFKERVSCGVSSPPMSKKICFSATCHIFPAACASVLLSWYALREEALRPPPWHPPTRFYFLTGSPCYLLCFLFFISIIVYLASFHLYFCPYRLVPMYFFHVLSWYALQGTPPPAFVFSSASLATYSLAFCS